MKKVILILVVFTIAFPLFLIFLLSFFSFYKFPLLLPQNFSLTFWKNSTFGNNLFVESMLTSIFIGILNALLSSAIGILTARSITKYDFKGKKIVQLLFSVPLFIPSIALFIGIHMMMIKFSLINSYTGVILAHMMVSIPYSINIFVSFFKGISPDLEDAARTLGCKRLFLYRKVIMPLLTPGIYLSISICFLISFSEYFSTFLIGGGRVITLSMLMFPYLSNGDYGNGAVLGVVFISINLVIFFIADYLARKNLKIGNYLFG